MIKLYYLIVVNWLCGKVFMQSAPSWRQEILLFIQKVRCIIDLIQNVLFNLLIGPSEVHALPLGIAPERSVHYFWD